MTVRSAPEAPRRAPGRSPSASHLARALLAALLVASPSCGAGAGPEEPPPGTRILFLGNSLTYTNDLPAVLRALLDSLGVSHEVSSLAYPNAGLEDHWNGTEARAAIARGGWDVVAMQQGPSATEGRPSLLEYSRRFAEEIVRAGARPALYMVWPSSGRSFDFDGVSESYRMAAERVDGLLFPAGEAWRAAWARDPDLALYGPDGFHPSQAGTYLAAAVIAQQLTGRDPRTFPARLTLSRSSAPDIALPLTTATILREAAAEANARFARR